MTTWQEREPPIFAAGRIGPKRSIMTALPALRDATDADSEPLATLIAEFDIDDWAGVSWGSGRAVDFIVPRALVED